MAYDLITRVIGTHRTAEALTCGCPVVFNANQVWQKAVDTGPLAGMVTGISQDNTIAGEVASIAIDGVVKANLGGTVTAGRRLGFDPTTDRLIEDPNGVIGIALSDGEDGDVIPVLLNISNPNATGAGTNDGVVTSGIITGTDLILSRSEGLPDVIIDLSTVPGFSGTATQADTLISNYTSGETLSAIKLVYIDPNDSRIYQSDHTDSASAGTSIGFTTSNAAGAGIATPVISQGPFSDPAFSFNTSGNPCLYLDTNGNITQTPPTSGFLLPVGSVTGPMSMYVNIGQPIFLI